MATYLNNKKITGAYRAGAKLNGGLFAGRRLFEAAASAGDPLINPAILEGVFGSGAVNPAQVTFSELGSFGSGPDKFACCVALGGGRVLMIPTVNQRLTVADLNTQTLTPFGSSYSNVRRWNGGVYAGSGRVIAIPCEAETKFTLASTATLTAQTFGSSFPGGGLYKFCGAVYVGENRAVAIPEDYARPVLIDVAAMTTTPFGALDNEYEKYRGGVYVGDGQTVAIPFNAPQPAIINSNTLTVTKFGTPDTAERKYHGGVFLGNKKVLAIPHYAARPAIIDAAAQTITPFGDSVDGECKWAGGVYIGGGKAIAMICSFPRFALIDTQALTISPLGAAFPDAWYWHYNGVYAGNGKIVTAPYEEATVMQIIDLGSNFHTATDLSEEALLSAWFNKY